MKLIRHIEILINLLKDIRKEPSPQTIGFIYSTAVVQMFNITFHNSIDPSIAIKHQMIRSKDGKEKLSIIISKIKERDKLIELWDNMENKRNQICYGNPTKEDVDEYITKFYTIKN